MEILEIKLASFIPINSKLETKIFVYLTKVFVKFFKNLWGKIHQ